MQCIVNPGNRGAGIPGSGLFTPHQLGAGTEGTPLLGLLPARGVIEARGAGEDAWAVAASAQVARYWETYRQVLVTDFRDFVLVGQDAEGRKTILESYRLAADEKAFWAAVLAGTTAEAQGERFDAFLKRVMLHAATLRERGTDALGASDVKRAATGRVFGFELLPAPFVVAHLQLGLLLQLSSSRPDDA